MQNLNIAEAGFGYIFKCIGLYYEGNIYFVLYLVSLVFLCFIDRKRSKRMREIFIPQFILMAITVYNPVFPVILNSFFDVNKEYYRFLWMSPVIVCIAAAAAVAVTEYAGDPEGGTADKRKRGLRMAVAVVFMLCLLVAGGSFLYKGGYIVSPTVYHMPTEIPEVSRIIHEDADEEYPRAMFEYDYNMLIRQYDASILLACDREAYLEAMAGNVSYDTAMEDGNYIHRLLAVVALGIKIPEDRFRSALENTHTEYVVVSTAGGLVPYLKGAGLTVAGETANHTVMHYDPEEKEDFELPDYSEVWRLTPQWYDFLLWLT
ncbi:MAG: hypothetical protein K6G42_01080 [Lachnospiraceae bacterium]|nr:hypothetical protein [Lachnospiraceae bacterium]